MIGQSAISSEAAPASSSFTSPFGIVIEGSQQRPHSAADLLVVEHGCTDSSPSAGLRAVGIVAISEAGGLHPGYERRAA
jgi:hypothetical protein